MSTHRKDAASQVEQSGSCLGNIALSSIAVLPIVASRGAVKTFRFGGHHIDEATDVVEEVAKAVPDPLPVVKPSGATDRSSAVYVTVRRADGTMETVGSRLGGIHAEDVAQRIEPGGQMSRPFGWRRDVETGELTWQPINVCVQCPPKYLPSLFPPGTRGDIGGAWGP
jgi:hypothetical protein